MTADIFWYEGLAQDGHLMTLPKDVVEAVPQALRDPEGHYVTSRAAAMVFAVNEAALGTALPKSYADLVKPEFKGKVVIGDPLKSGTHFVTLALLSRKLGWDWYRKLRANEVIIEGGNSAVLRRVETGDRPVGLLLLENLLKAQAGKSAAKLVVPEEGAVVIPSPIAVMARTQRKDDALKLCRLMMQKSGQEMMVRGRMYPVVAGLEGPKGAPPFQDLLAKGLCPDPALIRQVAADAEEIKETFVREMLE
jgi:iron(III) transport system substrate-binding protein